MFPKTPWRWKSSLYMFNLFREPATQCKAGSARVAERVAEGATFEPGCFPLVHGQCGWGPSVVHDAQALFFAVR